jgi:LDH2 family malate/lactate/ureidoglycolate dehydrogenase
MVELLAGIAIGDMTSQESMAFADGTPTLPYGGEIIIAIDPVMLLGEDVDSLYARGDAYLNQFNAAGARLPSQRRFKARQQNTAQGYIELDDSLYQDLQALLQAGL